MAKSVSVSITVTITGDGENTSRTYPVVNGAAIATPQDVINTINGTVTTSAPAGVTQGVLIVPPVNSSLQKVYATNSGPPANPCFLPAQASTSIQVSTVGVEKLQAIWI